MPPNPYESPEEPPSQHPSDELNLWQKIVVMAVIIAISGPAVYVAREQSAAVRLLIMVACIAVVILLVRKLRKKYEQRPIE